MSKAQKGKIITAHTRKLLSEINTGKVSPNKGKSLFSIEQRQRMSELKNVSRALRSNKTAKGFSFKYCE